jgi:hypothetical protein
MRMIDRIELDGPTVFQTQGDVAIGVDPFDGS